MQTKLKALLFEKKITPKELARRAGISERDIADKLRGKTEFTCTEVFKVCRTLKIENPLDVFLPRR